MKLVSQKTFETFTLHEIADVLLDIIKMFWLNFAEFSSKNIISWIEAHTFIFIIL